MQVELTEYDLNFLSLIFELAADYYSEDPDWEPLMNKFYPKEETTDESI